MAKRGTLANFTEKKPSAAPLPANTQTPAAHPPAQAKTAATDRKLTLRINPEAWRQLKLLALDEGRPAHALLIDALNALFKAKGKPPLA